MAQNVILLNLSIPSALRILREVAADSSRVFFTHHAKQRMRERKISRSQVDRCLAKGSITEGPARDAKGNWKITLEIFTAGESVSVAVAIDYDSNGNFIVVVTVF